MRRASTVAFLALSLSVIGQVMCKSVLSEDGGETSALSSDSKKLAVDNVRGATADLAVAASNADLASAPSELNAADDLGAPVPKSIFSQSFAMRRISPLEFRNVKRNADGVPIYHGGGQDQQQPLPQKRGGAMGRSVDYGESSYPGGPIEFDDDDDEGHGRVHHSDEDDDHYSDGGHSQYDDYGYDDGEGRHGGHHEGGGSYEDGYDYNSHGDYGDYDAEGRGGNQYGGGHTGGGGGHAYGHEGQYPFGGHDEHHAAGPYGNAHEEHGGGGGGYGGGYGGHGGGGY